MTKEEALEKLELENGAGQQEIKQQYQEFYNEFQLRITNAPTTHQKRLYQKKLKLLEEAYSLLTDQKTESLDSDIPWTGPSETLFNTQKVKKNNPRTEEKLIKKRKKKNPFFKILALTFTAMAILIIYFFILTKESINTPELEPSITGDFNGDGLEDTLYANVTYGLTKDSLASIVLYSNEKVINSFFLTTSSKANNLHFLKNEGDLNNDGRDEISFVIDWNDSSNKNTYQIASYNDLGVWEVLYMFDILEIQISQLSNPNLSLIEKMNSDKIKITFFDNESNDIKNETIQLLTKGVEVTKNDPLRYKSDFNDGIIFPANAGLNVIHESGFDVYSNFQESKIGKLYANEQYYEGFTLKYLRSSNQEKNIEFSGVTSIGYEEYALTFDKRDNGFVKIFTGAQSLWIKEKDLQTLGYDLISYTDFLIRNSNQVLGYYADEPGLALREQPNNNSREIKYLKGDLLEITLTNKLIGRWNKVTVIEYYSHPCNGSFDNDENVKETFAGWIELLDKNGNPNVWFYSGGC
ncbi:FG-GAP repeat domain-containing protein [Tamlana flava]|uniref:FG-GAP repeat domain-containing protein n=1 Tax=Tamlana flava TaxID=3158572 RepID=UPI00351B8D3A